MAKAYSSEIDNAKMLHEFEMANSEIECVPYFEYVRSKANISDLPSRAEFEYLVDELGAEPVLPLVLPNLAEWADVPHNKARKRKRARRGKEE